MVFVENKETRLFVWHEKRHFQDYLIVIDLNYQKKTSLILVYSFKKLYFGVNLTI